MASNSPIIVILGPTASGKSALGMELAKKFDGEIICADSRTVYKGMDVGTAKPSQQDQQEVPHHLLDVLSPNETFTASDFKTLANQAITEITKRGKVPIMVGGSGLYIDALLFDFQFSDNNAPRDTINPTHLSPGVEVRKSPLRPNTMIIGIKVDRAVLKERIAKRVDQMIDAGLVRELKNLIDKYPESKALRAPGYKAFRSYINDEISLAWAKEVFIKNDYQLAKRQMTWFRRNKSIHWVEQQSEAVDLVTTFLCK